MTRLSARELIDKLRALNTKSVASVDCYEYDRAINYPVDEDGIPDYGDGNKTRTRALILVRDIGDCMFLSRNPYPVCVSEVFVRIQNMLNEDAQKINPTAVVQCFESWAPGFHPDEIAAEIDGKRNPGPGYFNRMGEDRDVLEILDALIAAPVMPPGAAGLLGPRIMTLLCALGSQWGCPGDPIQPGAPEADHVE